MFALASAACGAAPGIRLLIAARAVQGAGAALLVPGSLALISASFPTEKRGAAIGTWSAWSAITAAAGPVAGGWVASHASWRWLFFFNVPVAALVVALATRRITETRDPDAPARLDLAGAGAGDARPRSGRLRAHRRRADGRQLSASDGAPGPGRGGLDRLRRRRGPGAIADGAAGAVPVADLRRHEPADAVALRRARGRALLRAVQPDSGAGLLPLPPPAPRCSPSCCSSRR